jgi:hypothetical protein
MDDAHACPRDNTGETNVKIPFFSYFAACNSPDLMEGMDWFRCPEGKLEQS